MSYSPFTFEEEAFKTEITMFKLYVYSENAGIGSVLSSIQLHGFFPECISQVRTSKGREFDHLLKYSHVNNRETKKR